MTPQEAKKILFNQWQSFLEDCIDYGGISEAYKMAMKALEQQSCEDCISRNELNRVISALTYWHPTTDGRLEVGGAFDNTVYKVEDVWRLTRKLPSVTPQQKMGKWIHREDFDYIDIDKVVHEHYMCKDCGFIHDFIDGHTGQYNYCPQCGAKMAESEGEI